MRTVAMTLKANPYKIRIGHDCLPDLGRTLKSLKIGHDAVVITSPVIKKFHGRVLTRTMREAGFAVKELIVPDGEKSKSAAVAVDLIEQIARYDVMKQVFIVAFGGGVIGDLAGFVAAAYKRGIPYVQVPTTFLAQIDSSIGGKTGVDLSIGKNLMGAFHQPKMVFSDTALLRTLPPRQLRNGFAEAVKYGIIRDRELFVYIEKHFPKVFAWDRRTLLHIVQRCSQIKTDVVLADEKETKGIRSILNFGHTIGHAIEAVGGFRQYDHGEAIAIGMRMAADISMQLGMIKSPTVQRINSLIDHIGLPERVSRQKVADIMRVMRHDKKFVAGRNRFVLVSSLGKVKVVEGVGDDIIKSAIRKYMA